MRKNQFCVMIRKKVPRILWDYGINWVEDIMKRTSGLEGSLNYRTSLEEVTGETPDISDYLDFEFYYWCWYNDNVVLGEINLEK